VSDALVEQLRLVGHRGYPGAFPENTLLGFQQAYLHGARFVETDVQLTRDGVPVLYHDDDTRRLSGVDGSITGRGLAEVELLHASYPARFGERFLGTPVSTLPAFAGWLHRRPGVTAFVEIKAQSIGVFGAGRVVERVVEALSAVAPRCVVISFDDQCVARAADSGARTGWVLPAWDARVEHRARELVPEFLFVDARLLPDRGAGAWRGPWRWAVYVVDDLATALDYAGRGIGLVETDVIGDLLDQYRAGPAPRPGD